ncbi:MAG: AI-2E family transporter [Kibdelosporangium sp.]
MDTTRDQRGPESGKKSGGLLAKAARVGLQWLIVAAVGWVLLQLVSQLTVVLIPLAIAILLAALFVPSVAVLARWGLPRALAATIVLVGGLAALAGLVIFVVNAIVNGLPDLQARLGQSYDQLRDWLASRPFGIGDEQIDSIRTEAENWLTGNRKTLVSGAFGVVSTLGSIVTTLVLALFLMLFFVYDGRRMWKGLVRPLPDRVREATDTAGRRAFQDLAGYVRATVIIALIDAVGIGIGLWVTGVPLVIPLAAMVFLGAFVPMVGAFVSGMLAVAVALVAQGPWIALIVAGIVVGVQQLEGNVFEPLLTSNAVKLHPVAVILAVTVGVSQAGIIGALLAVPVVTTARAIFTTVREQQAEREPALHTPG